MGVGVPLDRVRWSAVNYVSRPYVTHSGPAGLGVHLILPLLDEPPKRGLP